MKNQRSADRVGGVELLVSWGHDVTVALQIAAEQWAQIQRGTPIHLQGEGYWYEGQYCHAEWIFEGGRTLNVRVEYTVDGGTSLDCGIGFVGTLDEIAVRPLP